METRVQRWGNSLALRIPKPLADEVGPKDNSPVQLSLHDRHLVIVPLLKPALSLQLTLNEVQAKSFLKETVLELIQDGGIS